MKCYRWKECSLETYQKTIMQQIQSLLENLLDKMFHCNSESVNLAVEHLKSIFDLSASLTNLKMSSKKTMTNGLMKNVKTYERNRETYPIKNIETQKT